MLSMKHEGAQAFERVWRARPLTRTLNSLYHSTAFQKQQVVGRALKNDGCSRLA